jgi:UDP-glucose 4-epimerase
MNILVTGGAGFIGSHIVDKLIEKGEGVIVVDDLSTGKKEFVNEKAKFYNLDICSKKLSDIFKEEKDIEVVIHQAAQASVINSLEEPTFDANVNILGSLNLLECCRKFDVEKIIYASSGGAIYGEPKYLPMDETHSINPLSPYGASKYIAEIYIKLYQRLYGLKFTNLRYANVYGPRQDPYGEAGVIAIFTNKLLKNERPTIFGDGEQTRDFVYVDDIAESNILSLEKGGDNKSFNIGTGEQTSVNKIFKLLRSITDRNNIEPIYGKERKGEVRHSSLDYGKAKGELNWEPKISLEEGLKRTVDYFQYFSERRGGGKRSF